VSQKLIAKCCLTTIQSRRCEPATSNCRQLLCTDVVIWSYTTVSVSFRLPFLCMFSNLQAHERYLPVIRGAGTPFPCVPSHFNHTSSSYTVCWGKCGNVSSAGWQVTLCNPISHVSSRGGEAYCKVPYSIGRLFFFFLGQKKEKGSINTARAPGGVL